MNTLKKNCNIFYFYLEEDKLYLMRYDESDDNFTHEASTIKTLPLYRDIFNNLLKKYKIEMLNSDNSDLFNVKTANNILNDYKDIKESYNRVFESIVNKTSKLKESEDSNEEYYGVDSDTERRAGVSSRPSYAYKWKNSDSVKRALKRYINSPITMGSKSFARVKKVEKDELEEALKRFNAVYLEKFRILKYSYELSEIGY